jgi:hypothetical protein
MTPFLTAKWKNLINITYSIDPGLLISDLPKGLNLDLLNGKAHVSLVAFEFVDTKVKDFKIPFHIDFPEINLRYYANYKGKRGVVFLREFVPRYCIALVADKLYNEPYQAIAMNCETQITAEELRVCHVLQKDRARFSIEISAATKLVMPAATSLEHHFKEHDAGFGKDKFGNTLFYRVEHPVWEIYPIRECKLNVDFGLLYGIKWKFLNDQQPLCALLAKGSFVKVFYPQKLENF